VAKRNAIKKNIEGFFTQEDLDKKFILQKGRCVNCLKKTHTLLLKIIKIL